MLLGDTNMYQGLLDDNELKGIKSRSNLEAALALMAASGPSTTPMNFGQVLLSGLQQGRKAQQEGLQGAVGAMDLREKLATRKNQQMIQGQMAQMMQSADSSDKKAQAYRNVGDLLSAQGQVDQASKYYDIADKLIPKVEAFTLGEGQVRYGQDGKIVAQGPEKKEATPSELALYKYARDVDGYKGSLQDFIIQGKRAGASNTNVSVKTGQEFSTTLAKAAAESAFGDVQNAQSAANTIGTLNNIENVLDKAITGTGANPRLALLRLGQTLGVNGRDDSERLAATSQVMQGLAQTQLNVAQSNKGQGTFTDFERKLLAQAASGDLNMTPPELKSLVKAVKKGATLQYNVGKSRLQTMQNDPNLAPISGYLTIPDMPQAAPQTKEIDFSQLPRGGR